MKSPYVNELEPDRVITTTFLVHSKEIRQKKTGDPYLSLQLGDRTGELDGKMWDNVAEVMETFDRDDFVKVKGLIQIFHNRPQLTIHKLRRVDDGEVDFADFFPASERSLDEMWAQLRATVAEMRNRHLKALLDALLDDPEIARRFRMAPAAKQIHHAWLGGLIEHVLSLAALAKQTAAHYKFIDLDLLLTGVVLHDIGKIHELSYERGFSYTSEGQLLGHMMIALRMVDDKLRAFARFSGAAAGAGGAHDYQPPRAARVRLPQGAAISRGDAAALSGRHGFEDGMHAFHAGEGSPGGGMLHRLQFGARPHGAEEGQVPGPACRNRPRVRSPAGTVAAAPRQPQPQPPRPRLRPPPLPLLRLRP